MRKPAILSPAPGNLPAVGREGCGQDGIAFPTQNDGLRNAIRIRLPRTGPRLREVDIAVIAGRGPMPVGTDGTGRDKPVVIRVVGVLPPGGGADDILRVRRAPALSLHVTSSSRPSGLKASVPDQGNGVSVLMNVPVLPSQKRISPVLSCEATVPSAAMAMLTTSALWPAMSRRSAPSATRHSLRL